MRKATQNVESGVVVGG